MTIRLGYEYGVLRIDYNDVPLDLRPRVGAAISDIEATPEAYTRAIKEVVPDANIIVE